ncbi:ATP/GTP-binding protein [Streptomyces lunaelactis]|uniref:ATP/GTP-binding protein n=1 Tax=Streptomyces lunaelactis TaxID=1535768 RepID=UPI0015853D6C|nr:ATP/GTP-binding protein [Streptomyces lunaelactis]NUK26748.1 ATP/GTP-binding protein [Streptomyces lunaelactis]
MAGLDLRALFGSNDRQLSADEAFTNRQGQWQTVAAALTEHLRHIAAPGFNVEDVEAPRRNVLVFYGVGGIGKSTLSRKLEAALAKTEQRPAQWGEPTWPDRPSILPVRIDLSRSVGTDFERVILTIRLALAELGRPLPAFDVALRRYWEHQHPGEPLEEYLRRGGLAARFGKALPQQMQSALSDVAQALLLPGTVGSVVGQVTGSLVRALRDRRQTVRALAGCTRLADLLEAEPDLDSLSYYPHLVAWELAQLPADEKIVPVILLDTFEDTGDRTHRDFERLLQRVVWLMPNAFFIVTGRSRLQWADEGIQGQLDWTGPAAWPGLAAHDNPVPRPSSGAALGRQILIGDFSREDCENYLTRRLTRDGQPLISEDLRSRIAGTLSDLTPEERHVLRAIALFDAFDLDLATRAAGLTHQAPALRLVERPFVLENPFGLWRYHLHARIRSMLRTVQDPTDDRWSPDDWAAAAERAFTALGRQWAAGSGRPLLVGCLRQGLPLARDFPLDLSWLTDAAFAYVSDSIWEPLVQPTHTGQAAGVHTAADALAELLNALARRQHEHRSRTVQRLSAVIDTGQLPDELHEMAVYYRAKAHRDLGRSEDSRHGMQYVADRGGRLAPRARRGLAHLARLAGDFPTALATADTLSWDGRHHRVRGDIWWPHGDMHQAAAAYETARTEAEEHGIAGERATSQAQRAFALAFMSPDQAADEIELAEQLLTGLVLRVTSATVRIAALIRDAGTTQDIEDRAELLRTEIGLAGVTVAEPILELALCFHYAVLGADHSVSASITRLNDLTRSGDYAYYVDIAHFMADLSPPADAPSRAQWLDGERPTRQRWRALVTTRRDRLHTAL